MGETQAAVAANGFLAREGAGGEVGGVDALAAELVVEGGACGDRRGANRGCQDPSFIDDRGRWRDRDEGMPLDLKPVTAVFELVIHAMQGPRQLAGLADRHKAQAHRHRQGHTDNEAPGLDSHDQIGLQRFALNGQPADHLLPDIAIPHQRRQIAKQDARLGEIRDFADQLAQIDQRLGLLWATGLSGAGGGRAGIGAHGIGGGGRRTPPARAVGPGWPDCCGRAGLGRAGADGSQAGASG